VDGAFVSSVVARADDFTGLVGLAVTDPRVERTFSTKPTPSLLRLLNLKRGCNIVSLKEAQQSVSAVEFRIFVYDSRDKLCVCDVDGTITKADIRGYLETVYLGCYTYIHDGVSDFLKLLVDSDNASGVLYLTSRPFLHSLETRRLIEGEKNGGGPQNNMSSSSSYQGQSFLSLASTSSAFPFGPIITNHESLLLSLYRETITKDTVTFKTNALLAVVGVFLEASSASVSGDAVGRNVKGGGGPFTWGIGNRENDCIAYANAGVTRGNILLVDTSSRIEIWCGRVSKSPTGISWKDGGDQMERDLDQKKLIAVDHGQTFAGYNDKALHVYVKRKIISQA